MPALFESLVELLASKGTPYEIIEHEEVAGDEDGATLLQFPAESILKTIGFGVGDRYAFVGLQLEKRIDYKRLAQALQVKRERLSLLPAKVVEDELGYQIGGLSPIHVDARISVLLDTAIVELDTVYCGIGVRNRTLKMSPLDLVQASGASLLNLARQDAE